MTFSPFAWLRSLHAKLFLLTALVTSGLTIAVALVTAENGRREAMASARRLALETAETVAQEIDLMVAAQDDRDEMKVFADPLRINDRLEEMAGPERIIFQIDVFKRGDRSRADQPHMELVASSLKDESEVDIGAELASYLRTTESKAEPILLKSRDAEGRVNQGWKVYKPIESRRKGRPPIGLVRVYCDMERWETVWKASLQRTYATLPFVIIGEFIILWVILGFVVNDPLRLITQAMRRLAHGDVEARADMHRRDELGLIAAQFNAMAEQMQRASLERETLISEIQELNASLQQRVDEALEELQAKNAELEQLNERDALLREELGQQERLAVAGQLTAAFAHEVGTPLNLVNSHLQLLLGQADLTGKTRERVDVIHTQITRVGDIVRKLLGLTRRPQLHREPTPLRPLIEGLHQLWIPTLATHAIHFELNAPEDCTLLVDRKQMEQIFINLVNNAVDAMPEGGRIELRVHPADGFDPTRPRWAFELADSGGGIPEDVLPKVFRPMFTTKPEGKGTGLGLPIVREIVRNHGGDVRLESRPGAGTTVIFSLPGSPEPIPTPTHSDEA